MILNSNEPVFIQIKNYYKHLIKIGAYKEGDSLPSVREVAIFFGVNPNTVQRSFTLLSEEGYVTNIPKKGFYVTNIKSEDENKEIKKQIIKLIDKGYTLEDIKKVIEEMEER